MFVTKRYTKRKRYHTVISDESDNCPKDNLCFGCRNLMAEMKACLCQQKKTEQQQGMVFDSGLHSENDQLHMPLI